MLSDRCPVCSVSVTLAHCGQTVGRIKMKHGTQVGLSPGHIVLDRDPAPITKKGAEASIIQRPPVFGPCLLWPNGWVEQDATWYGGRPRPGDIALDWDPAPPKRGTTSSFRPMSIVAKRLDG